MIKQRLLLIKKVDTLGRGLQVKCLQEQINEQGWGCNLKPATLVFISLRNMLSLIFSSITSLVSTSVFPLLTEAWIYRHAFHLRNISTTHYVQEKLLGNIFGLCKTKWRYEIISQIFNSFTFVLFLLFFSRLFFFY